MHAVLDVSLHQTAAARARDVCSTPSANWRGVVYEDRLERSAAGRGHVAIQSPLKLDKVGGGSLTCPTPAGSAGAAGDEVDSMAAVAKAYTERSLEGFQGALSTYPGQLTGDPIVHRHLQARPPPPPPPRGPGGQPTYVVPRTLRRFRSPSCCSLSEPHEARH